MTAALFRPFSWRRNQICKIRRVCGVPWVSLPGPTSVPQGDSVAKRQPFCVLVGVVTSCVLCARVRGHVSHSCATENAYTPARLEALFKPSVVAILSHSYHFHHIFCGLWVLFPTRHLVRCVRHLFRDLIGFFLLVVGNVAIHLVHANVNLFSLGRLINFECCRVCPWISRETCRTSCQQCCEHLQFSSECQA